MLRARGRPGGRGPTEDNVNVSGRARGPGEGQAGPRHGKVFQLRHRAACHRPPLGGTCWPEVGAAATRQGRAPTRTVCPAQAGSRSLLPLLCADLSHPSLGWKPRRLSPRPSLCPQHSLLTWLSWRPGLRPHTGAWGHTCLRRARRSGSPGGTPRRPGPPWGG